MEKLGRNEPCHCGSGKKYKKCCLRKDEEDRRKEQEEQQYELDVELGRIDPFAGDEDWEEEPENEIEEYPEEEYDLPPDYPPIFADESPEPDNSAQQELSPEEVAIIDQWGEEYIKLGDPDELRNHIEQFMAAHPELVRELYAYPHS